LSESYHFSDNLLNNYRTPHTHMKALEPVAIDRASVAVKAALRKIMLMDWIGLMLEEMNFQII
jgi:hypothetical protein